MSWAKLRMVRGMAERRALRRLDRRAADKISTNFAQEKPTADDASGCEGRAAEVLSGPAPVEGLVADPPMVAVKARQSRITVLPPPSGLMQSGPFPTNKIDISAAPSGMEAAAARWEGKGAAPGRLAQAVPVLCEGKVLCRCGAQGPGQTRGPVPVWFGEKCIEAGCELRKSKEAA